MKKIIIIIPYFGEFPNYFDLWMKSVKYNSDIDFLLNMYCRGSVDMTVEWVLNDIPIKKEEIVSYLIEAIPDKLKEYMK